MRKIGITFLIISLGINAYTIYKIRIANESLTSSISKEQNVTILLSQATKLHESQLNYSGGKFFGDKSLIDSIKTLIGIGPKLFFSYNETSCESCISTVLNILDSIGNQIGYDKIILLTNYRNRGDVLLLSNQHKFKIFNCDSQNLLYLNDRNFFFQPPNLFIMDENMVSIMFFYYSSVFPSLNDYYFKAVDQYLKNY